MGPARRRGEGLYSRVRRRARLYPATRPAGPGTRGPPQKNSSAGSPRTSKKPLGLRDLAHLEKLFRGLPRTSRELLRDRPRTRKTSSARPAT